MLFIWMLTYQIYICDFIHEYVDKRNVNDYFSENLSKSGKVCKMLYSALNGEIK